LRHDVDKAEDVIHASPGTERLVDESCMFFDPIRERVMPERGLLVVLLIS
jgi:hypothetical protein